jgi:hypothetical protein
MLREQLHTFRWLGSESAHFNIPAVSANGPMAIGRFGGLSSAGANRNEDAALAWCSTESVDFGGWEFAALMDAHGSAQSAALVMDTLEQRRPTLAANLDLPASQAFPALHSELLAMFNAQTFRARARQIYGETSCLLAARKSYFLWWMTIGECQAYLFHPELAQRGQYALNQRSAFEWVGRSNVFDLPIPCYASGVRELRGGRNTIVLTTDGLLDAGSAPFKDPAALYALFTERPDVSESVQLALLQVHAQKGRDSATLIAWDYVNPARVTQRSN